MLLRGLWELVAESNSCTYETEPKTKKKHTTNLLRSRLLMRFINKILSESVHARCPFSRALFLAFYFFFIRTSSLSLSFWFFFSLSLSFILSLDRFTNSVRFFMHYGKDPQSNRTRFVSENTLFHLFHTMQMVQVAFLIYFFFIHENRIVLGLESCQFLQPNDLFLSLLSWMCAADFCGWILRRVRK